MEQPILSVSDLNQQAKLLLESSFGTLWIEGEISNFVCPASGHWYFSLKDDKAQVRGAMFRGNNSRAKFLPENGMQVLVRARVSLYPGRGDYQLIVEHIEPAGLGALQQAFEQLKKKLDKEGLFDEQHKQDMPEFPKAIGVVTSKTGAAIRDILSVLSRRYPLANVIIYPTLVQGDNAAEQITAMIETANERKECDVLLISRGGGSLEDLWCFNEEVVARAIFNSKIPTVSGVGHEVDFTITDFVADYRAPTPSAAAEYVSPDQEELMQTVDNYGETLIYHIKQVLQQLAQQLSWLTQRLLHQHPKRLLEDQTLLLKNLFEKLHTTQARLVENRQSKLRELARALNAMSPLAVLDRGYAVARKGKKVLKSVKQVKADEKILLQLSDGELDCRIL